MRIQRTLIKRSRGIKPALFNKSIPLRPTNEWSRQTKLPKWIKRGRDRPSTLEDALECIPTSVAMNIRSSPAHVAPLEARIVTTNRKSKMGEKIEDALLFDSIEMALRMEASFWLERQFCSCTGGTTRHWYDYTLQEMIHLLIQPNS